MENKLEYLKEYLKGLGSVAVAFSSGVDSTFLLKAAHDVNTTQEEIDYAVSVMAEVIPMLRSYTRR